MGEKYDALSAEDRQLVDLHIVLIEQTISKGKTVKPDITKPEILDNARESLSGESITNLRDNQENIRSNAANQGIDLNDPVGTYLSQGTTAQTQEMPDISATLKRLGIEQKPGGRKI